MNRHINRAGLVFAAAALLSGAALAPASASTLRAEDEPRLEILASMNGRSAREFLIEPGGSKKMLFTVKGSAAGMKDLKIAVSSDGSDIACRPAQAGTNNVIAACEADATIAGEGDRSMIVTFSASLESGHVMSTEEQFEVRARKLDVTTTFNDVTVRSGKVKVQPNVSYTVTRSVKNTTRYPLRDLDLSWEGGSCHLDAVEPQATASCPSFKATYTRETTIAGRLTGGTDPVVDYPLQAVKIVFKDPSFPRDVDGDDIADAMMVSPEGRLHEAHNRGNGTFDAPKVMAPWALKGFTNFMHAGQWDGSGVGDLWAVETSDDLLALFTGRLEKGRWVEVDEFGCCGWTSYSAIFSPGDMDGDGLSDVLAIDKGGKLYLYKHRADNTYAPRQEIDWGWDMHARVFAAGDQNRDGKGDIMAIDGHGALWLYEGLGSGRFAPRKKVGAFGWEIYADVVGWGDLDGDGRDDLVALDRDGVMWRYENHGNNDFHYRHVMFQNMKDWQLVR